jgi:hypothetical protein
MHEEIWRRSQVVRQRSAKPLFSGSNPLAASNKNKGLAKSANPFCFIRGFVRGFVFLDEQ